MTRYLTRLAGAGGNEVIKFVSDFRSVDFSGHSNFLHTKKKMKKKKTDRHDRTKMLFNLAFNAGAQALFFWLSKEQ